MACDVRTRLSAALAMCVAVCLLLGAAGPASQPDTEPAMSAGDLTLLHRLESGTWHERKAAEGQIAGWDVTRMPDVRAMLAHTTSPEAQARLHAALAHLQERAGTDTSVITLHEKGAAAKDVYRELFGQAFAPLKTDPANLLDSLPPITVDADRQPFWSVLQQLQKKTDIGLSRDPSGTYALRRQSPIAPGPQMISGPFLIVVTGTQLYALPPQGPGDKDFLLNLQVYSEPKVLLLQLTPTLKLDKFADDRGNSLEQEPIMFGAQDNLLGQQTVVIGLRYPAHNRGTHLVTIRGTMKGMISLHSVGFDIANPVGTAPQSVDLGGVTLKFTGCKKVGNGYQVDFVTTPDPKNRMGLSMQGARLRLLDAKGRELTASSIMSTVNPATGDTFKCSYSAPSGPGNAPSEPKRLIWNLPTDFRLVDIPFDFENVSIPIGNK